MNAEKAGANVTQLLAKLDAAGQLLSSAQNAYDSGNNSVNVDSMAENINQIASQVNVEALNLRSESLIESQNKIEYTLVFSVAGAVVFGIILFLVWRRYKRGYLEKVLSRKPEVVQNAT